MRRLRATKGLIQEALAHECGINRTNSPLPALGAEMEEEVLAHCSAVAPLEYSRSGGLVRLRMATCGFIGFDADPAAVPVRGFSADSRNDRLWNQSAAPDGRFALNSGRRERRPMSA